MKAPTRAGRPDSHRATCDRLVAAAVGRAPGRTLPLFSLILSFRRRKQGAWCGQAWLAAVLDVDERTIRRHLAVLVAADLIDVEGHEAHHDPATGQWRRRTNRYRCRFPKKRTRPKPTYHQVTPSGHSCPVNAFSNQLSVGSAPCGPPPTPPPRCISCDNEPPPGRWRCDPCQDKI